MSSPEATSQKNQYLQANVRRPRRLVSIGMTTLLVAVLGLTVWLWCSSPRVHTVTQAVQRGRDYLRRNRPDLAFQAVCDVRDNEPGAGEAVALAAMALIQMGELRVARLALERALRLQPDQFEATVTLAELNVDLGNGQRGADLFEAAAKLRPREPRVWLALAKVLQDLSEPKSAIAAYEKVLELDPGHREALIGIIRCWLLSYDPGRAEPWVTKAIERYPDDPIFLGMAARQAYGMERLDEAITRADRTLARDPRNVDALVARARARGARSQWKQALPDAESAAAAAPNDLEALTLLMMIDTRLGLTDQAATMRRRRSEVQNRVQLMDRLMSEMEEKPEDPDLRWRLGQAALEGGSAVLAGRCFEAALTLDPGFQPARESLAALHKSHPEVSLSR
jgi:tetratricopeptide (TPR) repeat protein